MRKVVMQNVPNVPHVPKVKVLALSQSLRPVDILSREWLKIVMAGATAAALLMASGHAHAQTMQMQPPLQSGGVPTPAMTPAIGNPASSALTIGAGTQKVPAGTMLTVAFNSAMDSRMTNAGDIFTAYLTEDFKVPGPEGTSRVILPAGTIVRGRVNDVKRPGLFSHGGAIFLSFDHVVLPSGELLPLTLNLSTENTTVNDKGALYMDPGIGKKVERGFEDGKKAFSDITDRGYQAGKQIAGGLGSIVTVPAAVVGGALVGTGLTTGKAAVAVVGRGETAAIKPGDTVTIDFGGSFNLPSE